MNRLQPGPEAAGSRLDAWLAGAAPRLSRARWQALIRDGQVRVDGRRVKASHLVTGAETVTYEIPPPVPAEIVPEPIPLDVLYEDADLIVINKQPGLVVHPAPGHGRGTLVNGLLHHCRDLAGVGGSLRPGIVHRLDKDTSGVLVAAKNEAALLGLARQFKQRSVRKEYLALVLGIPRAETGTVESLVGRSSRDRKRMSASAARGRPAVSHYALAERLRGAALLRVRIETGRTHQIRVHLAHLGHPVLGDRQYGARRRQEPVAVSRQMLHAERLQLRHPATDRALDLRAPIPGDMEKALDALREG
jgi:23S rRNA pseudouridine1911/1915/1917 synthase